MAPASVTRETGEKARDAALSVPGVAGLHGGRVGEVALLLPGTRIEGIRAANRGDESGLEVHIVFDVSSGRDVRCLLYTSPSPRDRQKSRMPSSA